MDKLKDELQKTVREMTTFDKFKNQVEMTVTSEGLRIELLETEAGMFFESGKPVPTASGTDLLTLLAGQLGKLPNNVTLEGHTDSKPFAGEYSNWELSTDRANSARKIMEAHGLRPEQVQQVRGYADRQLRHPEDPESPSNRRISVIVQYQSPQDAPAKEAPPAAPGGKAEEKKAPGETSPNK